MNVGLISTYNTRCGAATYSEHLVKHMNIKPTILAAYSSTHDFPDDEYTVRCWNSGYDNFNLVRDEIVKRDIRAILIVFHPGLIATEPLTQFIDWCYETNRPVTIIITSLGSVHQIPPNLNKCYKAAVQIPMHLEFLHERGFIDNTFVFPHGLYVPEIERKKHNRSSFLIGNFGFFLPNKGIFELIQAVHLLRVNNYDFALRLVNAEYPAAGSGDLIQQAKTYVKDNNLSDYIEFHNDFLRDEDSLKLLAECDLYVHPYRATIEPTSGSVRYGLASGIPVAVTPNPIFDDLTEITFKLPGYTHKEMADGIFTVKENIIHNTHLYQTITSNAAKWVEQNNYKNLVKKLEEIILESLK